MSTMQQYTGKGPFARPTDYGHTVQNVLNSTYFNNLNITYNKLSTICQKIKAIQNSLIDASGSDINKVNDDLNSVYQVFFNLKDKIDSRGSNMLDKAIYYDKLYELKRKSIGTIIYQKSESRDGGFATIPLLLLSRKWDKLYEVIDVIKDVVYNDDGNLYYYIERTEKTVDRESGVMIWDNELKEVGEPERRSYNYYLKILPNGDHEPIEGLTFITSQN